MKAVKTMALAGTFFLAAALGTAQPATTESGADAAALIRSQMVAIDGGTFLMGSADYEQNEGPVHEVTLDSFFMLRTEVTQAQYRAVMGENLSHFQGDDRPVEEVSWYDAVVFCNRLSELSGLIPAYSLDGETDVSLWGDIPRISDDDEAKARWNAIECDFHADGYRLPTEAEWEYAARGGEATMSDPVGATLLYGGSSIIALSAWNGDDPDGETHPVAGKLPNPLGLYDMSGNVWEWCWDWYGNYGAEDIENPTGAEADVTGRKIRRGGSIASAAVFCRNANRASSDPDIRGIDLGFRVVSSYLDLAAAPAPAESAVAEAMPVIVVEEPVVSAKPDAEAVPVAAAEEVPAAAVPAQDDVPAVAEAAPSSGEEPAVASLESPAQSGAVAVLPRLLVEK